MKNIIAITSLLAAGTLCANAEEFIWTSTDGDFSGFKNADENLIAITGDFSLEMTFQLSSYHTDCVIQLSPDAGFDKKGSLELGFSGATGKIYTYATDDTASTYTTGGHFSAGRVVNNAATLVFQFSNYNAATNTYSLTVTYPSAWSAGSGDTFSNVSFGSEEIIWTQLNLAGTTANPSVSSLKLVTENFHVIPEPSAFGLLAGLGALALAGTRRRRRK